MDQVSYPVSRVVPISLYALRGQLHYVLRNYKDHRVEAVRRDFTVQVAAILSRFFDAHGDCIRVMAGGGDWDTITSVPSSASRVGQHPLEVAIGMSRSLRDKYEVVLRPGAAKLSHLKADDQGYAVVQNVRGRRLVVIDDTFTSGARAQSAASCLQAAGAEVMAVVAVGRVINPDFSPEAASLWEHARSAPFDFDLCCIH
jgi:predicted amidophosphoribosyltransferase